MHVHEEVRRLEGTRDRPRQLLERLDDLVRVVVVEADVLDRLEHLVVELAELESSSWTRPLPERDAICCALSSTDALSGLFSSCVLRTTSRQA